MESLPSRLASCLMAFCALLCMVATLNAGLARIHNNALNLQHAASGDILMADGGWFKACDGGRDDCDDHLSEAGIHVDGMGLHHHHHGGDTPSGVLPQTGRTTPNLMASVLDLRPLSSPALHGRDPATQDQPPKA